MPFNPKALLVAADLFIIVEREDNIRPVGASEGSVGARLPFNLPAGSQ